MRWICFKKLLSANFTIDFIEVKIRNSASWDGRSSGFSRALFHFVRASIELSGHSERKGVERGNPMIISNKRIASAKNALQ